MKRLIFALLFTLLALPASAQTKPYGAFDIGVDCKNVPSWIAFSGFSSNQPLADYQKAAKCSREKGIKWVIKFGFDQIYDTRSLAEEAKAKAIASGLMPHLLAQQFNEEWYGQAASGVWGPPSFETYDWVRNYGTEQHRILKEVMGLPVVYVDAYVNNDKAYGLGLYRPEPGYVDVWGIETYVPNGGTWETHVAPFLNHMLNTVTKPIALIGQTFKHPREWNDGLSNGPSQRDGELFKQAMNHPKVIAAWLFTWRDRENGIKGGQSLPTVVSWFR